MRLIERQMNRAILERIDWRSKNTSVEYESGNEISYVFLHGHKIAEIGEGFVKLYDGDHRTQTTKSRLNAILRENGCGDEYIYQKDYEWFISYNGKVEEFVSGMTLR